MLVVMLRIPLRMWKLNFIELLSLLHFRVRDMVFIGRGGDIEALLRGELIACSYVMSMMLI